MKCPDCGNEEKNDALFCSMCKNVFRKDYPQESPEERAESLSPEDQEYLRKINTMRDISEKNIIRKLKAHSVTGAVTFAILAIVFGFPDSLDPLPLLLILILSAVFGLPLGYIISAKGGGLMRGALISSGVFTLMFLILNIGRIAGSENPYNEILFVFLMGFIFGALPGAVIGYHIDLDNT